VPHNDETRQCTKCLVTFPIENFYKMGNRLDSWCKGCKKSKRRATYVDAKTRDSFNRLKKIADIIYEGELKVLQRHCNKLQEMVGKCERRVQQ